MSATTSWAPNESYWLGAIDREHLQPPLEGSHEADVVCLGGGYTSLLTAYLLKKRDPSLEVAVVEANYVGFGSSGRNGGMVLHEPHLDRVAERGAEMVRFTYDETVRSVDFIDALAREEGFDCELERTGYLDISLYPVHQRESERKRRKCEALGIELSLLDRDGMRGAIRSERFLGALRYPKAAALHPGKYIAGLKRAALGRGVTLYENTPVEELVDRGEEIEIGTRAGGLRARKLVVGLNAYAPAARLGVVKDHAVTLFSFIILTEPLAEQHWKEIGWQGREGYSDKRRLHNYVRLTGDRILFGGRVRYHFGLRSPAKVDEIYENLRRELLATYPSLEGVEITHRWCGPVAISWRRTPMIGRAGRNENVSFAHGYSGMGVSLATLAGRVLADLVEDNEEPWRKLLYLHDPLAPLPPEPFRFIGFQSGYYGMTILDLVDRYR